MLTSLEIRSKAAWGYDDGFMRAAIPDLVVTPDDIARSDTYVVENAGCVVGFVRTSIDAGTAFMHDLFVEPAFLRSGAGRALFEHAVASAREQGAHRLTLHADPNAEVFYRRMGMTTVDYVASSVVPERRLPVMTIDIGAARRQD